MKEILTNPWPWYVTGPLIGLMVPLLLILGNKSFGISASLRHICAACIPTNATYFHYDWKKEMWNIALVVGIIFGGILGGVVFQNSRPVELSAKTVADLNALGIQNFNGLSPVEIFNFQSLLTVKGFVIMIVGGFFVGFGTRYCGGCTSGHAISGVSNLQWPSLVATCCFFASGTLMSLFILPYLMKL
ncbi:MAG: YeeE/YedE family protein [Bacteroidetes bacterium]|nr:YeeE/YedE family protein [Bacteroidota bacterium]